VAVGTEAEVADGLTGVLGTTEDQGVGTSGGTEGQLVEGDGLTTGGQDAGTGGGGEAQSSHGDLGELEETVVVGDGAHNNNGALLVLGDVGNDAGQRDRGTVDLGHKKAAQDDLVEGRVGTAYCEDRVISMGGVPCRIAVDLRARKR